MKIAIIIPTLNEADAVATRVAECLALAPAPEVIVSDGGSIDGTAEQAAAAGALVVRSRRGRGVQMNAGASAASADVLVFLHVDVTLSQEAWSHLWMALADPMLIGGAFRRRFDSPSMLLEFGSRLADLRGAWLQVYLGDQAIFARRAAFRDAGGYPSSALFEDLEFSRRLRRTGRTALLRSTVLASSRRFDVEGNAVRLLKNLCLMMAYALGVDPDRLARRYYPEHFGRDAGHVAPRSARQVIAGQDKPGAIGRRRS